MRFLIVAMAVFLIFAPHARAQQTCLNADIQDSVKALMQETTPESRRVKATKQVEIGIAKGIIKAENKDDIIGALVEYSVRKEAACLFPPELNARVSNALAIIPTGGKACADGQFEKIINRQFKALQASDGFPVFEAVIKEQISSNVIPSLRTVFLEKWDSSEEFRSRVIRAGLELNVMYTNKCTNLPDPVLGIIAEF